MPQCPIASDATASHIFLHLCCISYIPSAFIHSEDLLYVHTYVQINKIRVTIRAGFPGHVLFFGSCPGVFSEMSGFLTSSSQIAKKMAFGRVFSKSVPV